jgi:hypothetical protein
VNVEIKEKSMQWMHIHAPNKLKQFKNMSVRKLMATVFWDRRGVLMVEFILQGTTMASDVYYKTLKKLRRASHSEQKVWNAIIQSTVPP